MGIAFSWETYKISRQLGAESVLMDIGGEVPVVGLWWVSKNLGRLGRSLEGCMAACGSELSEEIELVWSWAQDQTS